MSDMARTLRRRPLLSRLFTTYLTLVVVVMFTGIAGAVPASFAEEGNPEAIASVMVPEESEESSGAVAPADEPLEGDAAPEEVVPVAAEEEEAAPVEEIEAPGASAPMMAPAAVSGEEVVPSTDNIKVNLEGYNASSNQLGWSNGNIGKDYAEGDWVPYRFTIDNSTGTEPYVFGAFSLKYDHYDSNKNAIAVDMTREWRVQYQTAAPVKGDGPDPVGSPVTPSLQDA
ncbi:MAG: hypothetical protein RQ731_04035, partial [Anaerosomatales bacterium]|nr:hypothetical protein [Anaerosomatales bacterium]